MKTSRGTLPLKEILVSRYHAAGQQRWKKLVRLYRDVNLVFLVCRYHAAGQQRAGHPGAQADSQAVHQVTMTLPQQQK